MWSTVSRISLTNTTPGCHFFFWVCVIRLMAIMFGHAVWALRRTSPTGFNDPFTFYPNASDECGLLIFRQMSAQTKRMNATTYVHLLLFPLAEHTFSLYCVLSFQHSLWMPLYFWDFFESSSPFTDLLTISVHLVCANKLILHANTLIPAKNQHAKVRTEPSSPHKDFFFVFSFITTLQKFQTCSTEALGAAALKKLQKLCIPATWLKTCEHIKLFLTVFFFFSCRGNKTSKFQDYLRGGKGWTLKKDDTETQW